LAQLRGSVAPVLDEALSVVAVERGGEVGEPG
jgi:hypothetical protein